MKRVLFLCVCAFMTVIVSAQVNWIGKMGTNFSSTTGDGSKMKIGYRAGIAMNYAFNDRWSLQPALLLSGKGTKGEGDATIDATYLEMPVYVVGKWKLGEGAPSFIYYTGPYLAYGLFGRTKSGDESINTFGDDGFGLKRVDVGLGIGIGLEITSQFSMTAEYQRGLTKLYKGLSAVNTNINIGFAYMF